MPGVSTPKLRAENKTCTRIGISCSLILVEGAAWGTDRRRQRRPVRWHPETAQLRVAGFTVDPPPTDTQTPRSLPLLGLARRAHSRRELLERRLRLLISPLHRIVLSAQLGELGARARDVCRRHPVRRRARDLCVGLAGGAAGPARTHAVRRQSSYLRHGPCCSRWPGIAGSYPA